MQNDFIYIVNTVTGGYYDKKVISETFVLYASNATLARDETKRTLLENGESTAGYAFRAKKSTTSQAFKAILNGARNWTDI